MGFGSVAQSGSYVTLGYGESASRAAMLGLTPPTTAGIVGNYITLGQAQSASLFLRFGLYIGGEGSPTGSPPDYGSPTGSPPDIIQLPSGGFLLRLPLRDGSRRIFQDDREIIDFLATVLQSGLLH